MGTLVEDRSLRGKNGVFADRTEAGKRLAEYLGEYQGLDAIVLAIPSGGVPVAREVRNALSLDFDLLVVRKVQIPWNPEAGFGAVNLDGDRSLNEDLVRSLSLSAAEREEQIERATGIIRRREKAFRRGRAFPPLKERAAILVDDGLASGYTMMAALRYVKKRDPSRVVVAVPTGFSRTVQRLLPWVDTLYCLNVRSGATYAVADAYRNWYDVSDEEVLKMMQGLISPGFLPGTG